MKKKKGNLFRNLFLFIILIVLTFYILLKDQDVMQIAGILKTIKLKYVFIGMSCMVIYVICEAINIGRTLKKLEERSYFLYNLKYALIGFFFSAITPAASGGQPMQIYYMHKDGISVSKSTLALLLNLTSMQINTISIALISLIFFHQNMNTLLTVFFIIGILLNLSALVLLVIGVFSKRMSKGLINISIKIMKKLKIKNIDEKIEKLNKELTKYQGGAVYLKGNRKLLIQILCTTFIQFLFYYSVTYWTYRAFGFAQYNIIQIIMMQSILYATVSGIPSPGAVGVSEGAFLEIFKTVYPVGMMSSAVLLNRGINFYFLVLISAIITIVTQIFMGKRKEADTI